MENNSWSAYCQYLRDWADSHSDRGFEGCCPVCYDEFLEYEWRLMQGEQDNDQ